MTEVSILIVCYKSADLILPCLEGVFEHTTGVGFEVLLTDCSNDGTVEIVRSRFPSVRIVDNNENLGFARANNLLATHASGRFLLLLNPDTIVFDNSIGNLYAVAQTYPHAGAIGGRSRLPDGTRDPGCRQSIPTLGRIVVSAFGGAAHVTGWLPEDAVQPREVETLHGAFMMVTSQAWKEVAGFDPSFFMYSEEMDLCHRLRQRGYLIVMTPTAEIIHLVGSGKRLDGRRQKLMAQARMHFLRKYWSPPAAFLGGTLLWLHAFMRYFAGTVGRIVLKPARARELREGYAAIVLHPTAWWNGFPATARH